MAEMTAPEEPTTTTTGPGPEEAAEGHAERVSAPRRTSGAILAVLALALLVASGVAVWQSLRVSDAEGDLDRRADAARTASDFTVALLSYDHADLDAQSEAIGELATEGFAEEFDDAMAKGLGASIEELRAAATASVTDVMVSEVAGDRARAVVVADSEITSKAGNRASTDTYLDVSMVFLDGRWQVDEVRTVATDAPQGADGAGGDGGADGDVGAAEPAG